jgi:hypothetical protein
MASFPGLIIGIDAATHCGVTEGYAGKKPDRIYSVNFGRKDDEPEDVYGRVLYWFSKRCLDNVPAVLGIERPIASFAATKTGKTTHQSTTMLNGIYSILVAVAKCKSITVVPVGISTWRASFFGKGKGHVKREVAKGLAIEGCRLRGWEVPPNDDDAAESAGIWDYTCGQMTRRNLFSKAG